MVLSKKEIYYEEKYASRFKLPVCVHVMLRNDKQVLLSLRNSDVADNGFWGLPGGHVESGESFYSTAIRELKEELGISITADSLELSGIGHTPDPSYMGMFFKCHNWAGEIKNMEPQKCHKLEFFDFDNLPSNIIPYLGYIFEGIKQQKLYVPIGF